MTWNKISYIRNYEIESHRTKILSYWVNLKEKKNQMACDKVISLATTSS